MSVECHIDDHLSASMLLKFQEYNFKHFLSSSNKCNWHILFLSLVSPVLLLLIGTIAGFIESAGKYPCKMNVLINKDIVT